MKTSRRLVKISCGGTARRVLADANAMSSQGTISPRSGRVRKASKKGSERLVPVGASKPPEELRVAAVLSYEGGDRCYNGPARSCEVQLTCGEEHAVLSVAEPDVCTYQIHMTSPAVCSAKDDIPKMLGDETEAAAPHQDL